MVSSFLRFASDRGSLMGGSFGVDSPGQPAPPWTTSEWFNADRAVQLADLRGRVVVLHAFQMLCPACVHHGVPQAQRVQAIFSPQDVQVIGLHTVFEHHAAMRPVSLRAFLHEYRISFPVGVDAPSTDPRDPIPVTMRAYGLQGTPSLLLIDRRGDLRLHAFGAKDDLELGAAIATLVNEAA
jgi:peroxiredoxin